MARKDYFVATDTPDPLYKTRMLQAGVPHSFDASAARLYRRMGVELSDQAPRKAAKAEAPVEAPTAEAPKATPKPKAKRATRRKK